MFAVARFARHFRKFPAELGPEQVRDYLNQLIAQKISASYFNITVAALRFLYTVSQERDWALTRLPFQKRLQAATQAADRLSVEEAARFLQAPAAQAAHRVGARALGFPIGAQQIEQLGCSEWLFPGRDPDQHISAARKIVGSFRAGARASDF